jgi:small subunit ribosomal protein S8
MMTDPISDMLTRIRNGNRTRKKRISMPASRIKVGIAQILKEEGFIQDYSVEAAKPSSRLSIHLKYDQDGGTVIRSVERVSKPGCRVYAGAGDLKPVLRGMGIQILSTPKGILSDRTARTQRIGGEVICKVT